MDSTAAPRASDASEPPSGKLARWAHGVPFALACYLVLRAVFGPVLWPFNVIEPLLLWLCMPSFVLLFVAFARRRRSAAIAHTLIACAWASMFGHLLFAPSQPPAGDGEKLTILTFNVAAGLAPFASIERLMREENADVVLLQEVSDHHEAAFEHALSDLYPHRDVHGLGIEGLGLFSRFPILEKELAELSSGRPYQRVVLDVRGERTTVYNVHPGLVHLVAGPMSNDTADLRKIARDAHAAGTALVAGDLNATENMDLCGALADEGLHDAFRHAGKGFGLTFPVFARYRGIPLPPFVRIDSVWHSQAYTCSEARVLPDAGSDHLPLLVVLTGV
ncbi:MAG TPA: endonuclease/exonuclease/phosphatase family protein [Planctomycetota bacterium]|nr:endonuclease/exonuclease/phosphatase family protein [Planctomycetota bacterium]